MAKKLDPIAQNYKDASIALWKGDLVEFDSLVSANNLSLTEAKFGGLKETALDYSISLIRSWSDEPDKLQIVDKAIHHIISQTPNVDEATINHLAFDAVRYGLLKTLDYLFDQGLDPNLKSNDIDRNLLANTMAFYNHFGLIYDRDTIISYLLDKGADPLQTPGLLHYVGMGGSHTLFMRLIDEFKYPLDLIYGEGYYPFADKTSAYLGVKKIFDNKYEKSLAEATKKNNDKRYKDKPYHNGFTPAQFIERLEWQRLNYEYLAAHQPAENTPPKLPKEKPSDKETQGRLNNELIEKAKNLDLSGDYFGAISKWKDELEDLLQQGADINTKDKEGATALHHIVLHGYDAFNETLPVLKEYNVNAKIIDKKRNTPLFYVRETSYTKADLIKGLLELGVDSAHINKAKQNVLAYIAANTDEIEDAEELVEAMMKAGVQPMEIDSQTEFHRAAKMKSDISAKNVGKEALKKGVDINAQDKDGRTALHLRVMLPEDDHSTVDRFMTLILENGIDVNIQDKDGNTAIHLAKDFFHGTVYLKILEANPDLSLKNNDDVSVLDILQKAGYHNAEADGYQHRRCNELIDKLLITSPKDTKLPPLQWKRVDLSAHKANKTSVLQIQGSMKLEHEAESIYYLGDNLVCVKGDIPEKVSCIDINTGEILWTTPSDTFSYWIYENGVLYFGKRVNGTSSYVAIDARTGKEIWASGFGQTYHAWKGCGVFDMGNKIVFSTASALVAIDKKNGKKLYKTKLSDYNLSVKAIVRGNEFVIQGSKSKSMAFYHYDMNSGELIKTTTVAKGMENKYPYKSNYILIDNVCWYITSKCELCSVNFDTGKYNEYKIKTPVKFGNHENMIEPDKDGFDIMIRDHSGSIFKCKFDLDSKKNTEGELHEYNVWADAESTKEKRDFYWDDRRLHIGDNILEMPDYRGDCRIWDAERLDNSIYIVLQAKGLEYGAEKTAVLHIAY